MELAKTDTNTIDAPQSVNTEVGSTAQLVRADKPAFEYNRPAAVMQRKHRAMADKSSNLGDVTQLKPEAEPKVTDFTNVADADVDVAAAPDGIVDTAAGFAGGAETAIDKNLTVLGETITFQSIVLAWQGRTIGYEILNRRAQ